MRLSSPRALAALMTSTAMAAFSMSAHAQTSADGRQTVTGLEEVIVTAQRREERLQDVPVSVTALSGGQLEQAQIVNAKALVGSVPSLTVTQGNFGRNDVFLGLRGQVALTSLANIDSSVGLYVNGIYYARTSGANVSFIDMDRVEVLRGPQGTLFGRNTIGGAVNVSTREPADQFEGLLKIGYGNYDSIAGSIIINAPLVDDKVAVPPLVGGQEFATQDQDYFRATMKARLNDAFEAVFYFDHLRFKAASDGSVNNFFDPTAGLAATSVSQPTALLGSNPPILLLPPAARTRFFNALAGQAALPDRFTTNSEFNPTNTGRATDYGLRLTAHLGGIELKSLSTYRKVNFHLPTDLDGANVTIVENDDYYLVGDQISQEFTAGGNALDERLTWIVGLYYFKEVNDNGFVLATAPPTAVLGSAYLPGGGYAPGATLSLNGVVDAKNVSKSAFAQASFEIVPQVRLTAGIRFVRDDRSLTYFNRTTDAPSGAVLNCGSLGAAGLATLAGGCVYTPGKLSFEYTPWTVGLDWKPNEETLIYGKASKGFRSGGLQQCCGATTAYFQPFEPESVLSYEVGAKVDLLDNRLRIGAAAYLSKFRDILAGIPVFVGTTNLFPTRNTGTADIKGLELDATALVGNLRLAATLGLVDATYKTGPYVGSTFPSVPETTWSLSADYPIEFSVGVLRLHADYAHQSVQYFAPDVSTNVAPGAPFQDVFSRAQKAAISQSGHGLLNGTISFELEDPNITLMLWGRNLANRRYFARTNTAPLGALNFYNAAIPGDPRTYGVSLQYRF